MNAVTFLAALPGQRSARWAAEAPVPVRTIDQYELDAAELAETRVLLTTMHQDQRWLQARRGLLQEFINSGGTMIVQGQIVLSFLEVLQPFRPMSKPTLNDYQIEVLLPTHPIFSGVDPATLNRRRGVAGFYARGSNPPPVEATVLTSLGQSEFPVDWVVRLGDGRLFVHSGNDLWTTFHEPAENARLAGNLLRWATNEENDP